MTTEVDIANHALTLLGEKRITSLTENSKAAREVNAIFTTTRDALLAAHNWSFAMARAKVFKSVTDPIFGYENAYEVPTDCLRAVLINDAYVGVNFLDTNGGPLVEGYTIEGRRILTNWGDPPEIPPAQNLAGITWTNDSGIVIDWQNAFLPISQGITLEGGEILAITPTDSGAGYYYPPSLTITPVLFPGEPSPTELATADATLRLVAIYPNAAGAGYTLGDVVELVGGTNTRPARIRLIYPGIPVYGQILDGGKYTAIPGAQATAFGGLLVTTGVAIAGGTGIGGTVTCLWGVGEINLTAIGRGYLREPVVTAFPTAPQVAVNANASFLASTVTMPASATAINLRYIRRVEDPDTFAPNFAKALGCQLAADLAESLTQSPSKRDRAMEQLKNELTIARKTNMIEQPPRSQYFPEDDWSASRR